MNFRTVCWIGVLAAGPFGLGFLLLPELLSSLYGVSGWNPGTTLIARLYGVGLLYTTGAAFAVKDSDDPRLQRTLGLCNAGVSAVAALLCLQSVTSGSSNALMWSTVALFGFFTWAWAQAGRRGNR